MFCADISGTTWAIKKFLTSICILVWRALRWKKIFSNPVTKSTDICKNAVVSEKIKLLEKIRHLETFFMDLRHLDHGSRNWTYIQTRFRLKNHHATSLSQARCVCRIFVNQISISYRNNDEQIRYLFLSICSLSIGHLFDKKKFFSFRHYCWWKSDSQKYRKHI